MSVNDYVEDFGRTLGEELLEPTRIYAKTITTLRKNFRIYGISHITGGGFIDNLPRILPKQCKVVIESSSWTPQPIFQYLQKAGKIPREDMLRTFNNGLGLVIVVSEKDCGEVLLQLKGIKETAYRIGSVQSRNNKESSVQFT
jgi:phosphoribosylformylglycinamidine cyclo-ligase